MLTHSIKKTSSKDICWFINIKVYVANGVYKSTKILRGATLRATEGHAAGIQ